MANMAMKDQKERIVEVNRLKLIETLESNKTIHEADYREAVAGYSAMAQEKLAVAYEKAKITLDERYQKAVAEAGGFNADELDRRNDYITLVDSIHVQMKVPRSYAKEYDAAIDMAKWDVRETLELTHAEFTCFVRDQWDWSDDFSVTNSLYKAGPSIRH